MNRYVLSFDEIDRSQVALAGGKGASLGELSHIDGIDVPPGFCVTTHAFQRIMEDAASIDGLLDQLSLVKAGDRDSIGSISSQLREIVNDTAVPDDVERAIIDAVTQFGEQVAYAVRSSATAEDLPTASFAGQQDTFLNIEGRSGIVRHVRMCWASLFSERAVTYRIQNGFDHRRVRMAVVVQRMVNAKAAGILFTADPLTGNRNITSIDATLGLGEALVSGLVTPDVFKIRDGSIIAKTVSAEPALTDSQAVQLEQVGRRIEAHFGTPQDIEWCLEDDRFYVVQSRPITTLFPIPAVNDDGNHVYVSVGHQQMMTDPMKPLGLSFWQMTTPRPMAEAGGRLFVDVTGILASPASRTSLLSTFNKSDPRITDALQTVLDRGDFIRELPDSGPAWTPPGSGASAPVETDPAVVAGLMARTQESIATARREIQDKSGPELFDFIVGDIAEMRRVQFDPQSIQVIMAGMEAAWWLNENLETWLGEKNVSDILTQSVPNNVTSDMGLALLDVADAIRPHRDAIEFLEHADDDDFLNELPAINGGSEARDAIGEWLSKYGMRGPGEIDITRPRWRDHPSMLLPLILGNIRNFDPGAGRRRFEEGRLEALNKEEEVLARLREMPEGEQKAQDTKRMIDRVRTFAGYREYPKYGMISRYYVYKEALMKEADRLVQAGVIDERDDIFYLRFDELRAVASTMTADAELIRERTEAFNSYQKLAPPRVLTSEGEMLNGEYRRGDVPGNALAGLPVSGGTVEGRARVVLDMENASLEPGDILVTAYTDPSWTPLFVAITGLVTEVGGLMTHGAVIAREYGLPAVVGVENATRLIQDGQRIRVHGTAGYVEIIDQISTGSTRTAVP